MSDTMKTYIFIFLIILTLLIVSCTKEKTPCGIDFKNSPIIIAGYIVKETHFVNGNYSYIDCCCAMGYYDQNVVCSCFNKTVNKNAS